MYGWIKTNTDTYIHVSLFRAVYLTHLLSTYCTMYDIFWSYRKLVYEKREYIVVKLKSTLKNGNMDIRSCSSIYTGKCYW